MIDLQDILAQTDAFLQELPPAPPALVLPAGAALAGWIDHTALKAETTAQQVMKLCQEARQHNFATVCVNPGYVPLAAGVLRGSGVGVCSVISFPLGAHLPSFKAVEAGMAIEAGATEIDMVVNIGALKADALELVYEDVKAVVDASHAHDVHVKVILEMCYLDQRQKIAGCLISKAAGADFVKTSTGFGPSGATVEDVALMRRVVGPHVGVKAAGGIRTLADALAMIRAGANRLGASAGISILQEAAQ
ncbi:MAG: deoxyribose-phosphate aldolase [Chloroflexi bacterium HGW-Chloroflexi-6]|nr:MAG: deoxyribose-phosphate aldolase [Chloroflexi bacterium HGW-Chloroflexi-6]